MGAPVRECFGFWMPSAGRIVQLSQGRSNGDAGRRRPIVAESA
jgi:hypothetical protein